jgi:hypothetical protein
MSTIEQEDERPAPTAVELLERAQQESAAQNQKLRDDYYATHPRAEKDHAAEEVIELRPGVRFHKPGGAKSPTPQTHRDETPITPGPTVQLGHMRLHGAPPSAAVRGTVITAEPPSPQPQPQPETQPERARTVFHGFSVQGERQE